jgi:urea transport system permease protein
MHRAIHPVASLFLPRLMPDAAATRRAPLTLLTLLWLLMLALPCSRAFAVTQAELAPLAADDFDAKSATVARLAASGDAAVVAVLQALANDTALATDSGTILIQEGDTLRDPATTRTVVAGDAQPLTLNNTLREQIRASLAAARLASPERSVRAAAIDALSGNPHPSLRPLIEGARARESDAKLKARLDILWSLTSLTDPDPALRLAAVERVAAARDLRTMDLLRARLARQADGSPVEPDARVREAARRGLDALATVEARNQFVGTLFAGLSLGSVLLLAALGLAITYGLIGVINMAHGEFLMIGAYATYVVQNLFALHLPGVFAWYPLAAVPVAFVAAALAGAALERLVLRHLYGRPLETLLTTFGVSLLLIQATRMVFGAQNVQVRNPDWMSGGVTVLQNLVLPYNRLTILAFSLAVIGIAWAVLNRTRLGLFVRAVTQNRRMAACVGIRTRRVDSYAFAFGAGIAGLGGCALSQIGNVGPDLGQSYIIDSFMAVVLGGVGQLAGTIIGAFGLGVTTKLVEPFAGAVLAKIAVLVLIVLFIQKRPQGMFAIKGRSAEA